MSETEFVKCDCGCDTFINVLTEVSRMQIKKHLPNARRNILWSRSLGESYYCEKCGKEYIKKEMEELKIWE